MTTAAAPATPAAPAAGEPAPTPAPAPAAPAPVQQADGRFGPPPGTPVGEFDPVHPRLFTDSTRSLFANIGKGVAAAVAPAAAPAAPAEPDDPYDHNDDPAAAAAPVVAAPAVAAPVIAAAPPPVPVIPQPDHRAALALEAREKAIADRETGFSAREKALQDREAAIRADAVAEHEAAQASKYLESGTEALTDLLKRWTGMSDDEVNQEWEAIIADGSGRYLKLPVEPEIAGKLASRRSLHKVTAGQLASKREVDRVRAELAARDTAEAKRREDADKQTAEQRAAEQAKADESRAHTGLTEILRSKDTAGKPYAEHFPNLMVMADPAAIVLYAAKQLYEHQPDKQHSWADAANLAEAHLKQHNEAEYKRLAPLFTPAAPAAPAPAPTAAAAHQGAPQGRGARATTLTNGAAAAPPVTPAARPVEPPPVLRGPDDAPPDMTELRRASFARIAEAIARRDQAAPGTA